MTDYQTGAPNTDAQGNAQFVSALLQATLTANRVTCMVALSFDGPQLWAYTCSLGLGKQGPSRKLV